MVIKALSKDEEEAKGHLEPKETLGTIEREERPGTTDGARIASTAAAAPIVTPILFQLLTKNVSKTHFFLLL